MAARTIKISDDKKRDADIQIEGIKANEAVIDRAAELAGISNYEVVELFPLTFDETSELPFFEYQPELVDAERLWAHPSNLAPGIYYRYIDTPSN